MKFYFLIVVIFMLAGCEQIQVSVKDAGKKTSVSAIYTIEDSGNGNGTRVENLTLEIGENLLLYAIRRSGDGEFLENPPVSWTLQGASGNLLIHGAGEAAEFIPVAVGTAKVSITIGGKVVKSVNLNVTPPGAPPLDVSNLVISNITTTGFTATLDFSGGSSFQSHTLFYCNETLSNGCDPESGSSVTMTQNGSSYKATVTGLTSPEDTFNVRVVSTDSVSVTGSPLNTTVTLIAPPLTVSNLVFSGVTATGFTATIDYSGGSSSQTHTLYYCSKTADSACDPVDDGQSVAMTKSGATFTSTVVSLSSGSVYSVEVVSQDSVTVTGSPMSGTVNLLGTGITISNFKVTERSKFGVTVTVNFTGDAEANSTVRLYYCNSTATPSCNPANGTYVTMTRSGSTYVGVISGLDNEGETLSLRVIATDPNGVSGSPLNGSQTLYDLYVYSLVTSATTHNGLIATVSYNGDTNNNGIVRLHYCNDTDNPGCDPLTGPNARSIPMTRNATTYTVNTTGLLSATDDIYDVLKIRVRGEDPDGVGHGSIGTTSSNKNLVDVEAAPKIIQITKEGFSVNLGTTNEDNNNPKNSVNTFFYCDETDDPNCDPLLGISEVIPSDKKVHYIAHNIPAGHKVSAIVRMSDPEGVLADSVKGTTVELPKNFIIPNPKDIFRSVGPGQTSPLAQGSGANKLTITGDIASFDSNLLPEIGVGDAVFYDANNDGAIDAVAFIHERTDNKTYNVKNAQGSIPSAAAAHTQWKIYRSYISLYNAELGLENSGITSDNSIPNALRDFDNHWGGKDISAQTGSDENWNFSLYAGTTADTQTVQISGWTKDREQYIRIFTPYESRHVGVSQRHAGTWTTSAYRLVVNNARPFRSSVSRTYVEGLQIEVTGSVNNIGALHIDRTESIVHSNIVRSSAAGTAVAGIMYSDVLGEDSASHEIWNLGYNNIVYGFTGTNSAGFFVGNADQGGRGVRIFNNTIYDSYYGLRIYQSGTYRAVTLVNNLIFTTFAALNTDSVTSGTWRAWNNITNDSSINSTSNPQNNLTNRNAVDIFMNPLTRDFRLKASSEAIDHGSDLSPYYVIEGADHTRYKFNTDILGNPRTGNFDVGAFEY